MRPRLLRSISPALILIVWGLTVPSALAAQVELGGILKESGASLRWDAALSVGTLRRGTNLVTFKPGFSWALHNNRSRISTGPIVRGKAGEILFSPDGAASVVAALIGKRPESVGPQRRPRIAAIIIDPGHGGADPGASHVQVVGGKQVKLVEKEIALRVAREVYSDLRARYPDKRIILTRNSDKYVSLESRTEIANDVALRENEAMIFVSIHANASFDPKAHGFEVWYLPPTYRRDVIDRKSLDGASSDLYPILNSMREEEYSVESVLLGKRIIEAVYNEVDGEVTDRGLKAESWFVVRNAKMPAVLIELGFLTNLHEAVLLSDASYLKKLSRGIYNGVRNFVNYFDNSSGFME